MELDDETQVGDARRRVGALAQSLRFDEALRGRAELVATELASNVWRHAGGDGRLLLQQVERDGATGLEMVAIDSGPGIADIPRAMSDGVSTAASHGDGLGACDRLSDEFDIWSQAEKGTVAVARLWIPIARENRPSAGSPVHEDLELQCGQLEIPYPGQRICGDAIGVRTTKSGALVLVADGVGHGPAAAEGSRGAVEHLLDSSTTEPESLLEEMHRELQGTRGIAAGLARVGFTDRSVHYAGVGNIQALVAGPGSQRQGLASHNGTVGWGAIRVRSFHHDLPHRSLLILHSDGLTARWTLDDYPRLAERDPTVIAAVLLRDHRRDRDDASILVARLGPRRPLPTPRSPIPAEE